MERTMLSSCRKLGCEMNSRRLKFSNPLPSRKEARQDGIIYWCKAINPNCQRAGIIVHCSFLSYGACNNPGCSRRNETSLAADTCALSINLKQKFSYFLQEG